MTPQEKSKELEIEEGYEDGEISDDEDDAPMEMPTNQPILLVNYPSSDDEKSPEDVINAYKEKISLEKTKNEELDHECVVDPKLCNVCLKNEHKYRCPRCELRTCSLDCSKKHKAENGCDGIRQPFAKVDKLSQYDSQKSIDDQKFMFSMKEKAGLGADQAGANTGNEVRQTDVEEKPYDPNALRYTTNSGNERYLLNAARFRHIWLGFTDEQGNESRHEQHSDTLFWNVRLSFKKQTEDGSIEVFEKTVTNIPETIRIVTVLKQFFKPRQYGCIVSESDLDLEKLKPFIESGIEGVNIFMEVHGYPARYYGILPDCTILDMTRNRVVADYPKFVITLKNEFMDDMQLLSNEELEQLQTKYGGIASERYNGGSGRGRGGRGFHRGGNGRGGSGNPNHQNNFRKRSSNGGHDGGFKRGRGNNYNGGNRRGGYQHRNNHQLDSFDPFEPFSGPNRLPMEYN